MSKTPELRFSNYHDSWQFFPLKDLVNTITTGKLDANAAIENGKYRFFTCSKEDYKTNSFSFDGDAVIINGNGDLGITKVFSGKFDAYQRTYVLMNFKENFKYIGNAIPVYLPEKIRTEAVGGAMPYIKIDALEELLIGMPSDLEQEDISNLIEKMNLLIESKKKELNKIEIYKKTMLRKMFPVEDTFKPEIRFDGYKENWSSKQFGKAFVKVANNSFSRDLLNYNNGKAKNIHYGDILIKFDYYADINDKNVPYINPDVKISNFKEKDYLKTGDVVFSDTAEDTTAGKMVEIKNENNIPVLSGLHTYACRPLIEFYKGYLGIYLNTPNFHDQLIKYMQGTKVTGYNYEYLCRLDVLYPSIDEQKEIVLFFNNIENIINNQKKEILDIENILCTLKEKLFVRGENDVQ